MTPRSNGRADTVTVNRAPVLTLWAAVVAERLGFDRDEALTLGRALAGLNAQSKGRSLGIFTRAAPGDAATRRPAATTGAESSVELMRRAVPVAKTPEGLRALAGGRPIPPATVTRYLESKFGDALDAVREEMTALAHAIPRDDLAAQAFDLYEAFRPKVPPRTRGWGAAGVLDLKVIRSLARKG
jgi:hypothetical protein